MDDTVFDEFDKLEQFVWATERAADGALLESERFLRESSIRISGAGALPASATSSSGHTDGSAAARPDRCPGIDLASAAAKPGKCPGRDSRRRRRRSRPRQAYTVLQRGPNFIRITSTASILEPTIR